MKSQEYKRAVHWIKSRHKKGGFSVLFMCGTKSGCSYCKLYSFTHGQAVCRNRDLCNTALRELRESRYLTSREFLCPMIFYKDEKRY